MLEDRSYMRDPAYGSRRSAALNLIIVLGVCFVIQNLLLYYSSFPLYDYFALTPNTLRKGWLWQLFTFNFLHAPFGFGGFFHILFNCWGIWIFGSAVEEALGPRRFFTIFLTTGIAGGILQALGGLLLPSHFGEGAVGASAGLFGLIGAYATLFPARQITMLLMFVLPITITAKFLLIFSAIVAVFGIMIPTSNIAHGAHLGGLFAGVAFIKWALDREWKLPKLSIFKKKEFTYTRQPNAFPAQKVNKSDLPSEEFISKEVDPILDKISAHGIQSLTERERKILEAARAKMAKR